MYIIVKDPWGSYVDGRDISHKDIVETFAKLKGFTTEETDKEPVIDMANSPVSIWENARILPPMTEISIEKLKEKFPSKSKKKK